MRSHLVQIAEKRAEHTLGCVFDTDHIVLVGDTRNDVAAARENGVRIIAVATGNDSQGDLARAGADVTLPNLADTTNLIDAIMNRGSKASTSTD
jgi:phosphoglycolate phosphatase-like HAD superfamily hydrolase